MLFILFTAVFYPAYPSNAADGGQIEKSQSVIIQSSVLPKDGHPRLDSQLSQMVGAQLPGGARMLVMGQQQEATVRVVVEFAPGQLESAATAISQYGVIETGYGNNLQVTVPLADLTALAELPDILLVRAPQQPVVFDNVVGQGSGVINADDWQAAGYNGTGIKIGILDIGFMDYAARLSQGEVPAPADTFWSPSIGQGSSFHGTACTEVVYDIAPGAEYYLATIYTDTEWGPAVDWLISKGVDIISCSLGFTIVSPGDGSGIISDKVEDARSAGILWSQSAGNYAQKHWQGIFTDLNANYWHDFVPDVEGNTIHAQVGQAISVALKWKDAWGAAAIDYDLYLFYDKDQDSIIEPDDMVDYSNSKQDGMDGNDYPYEWFDYTAGYNGVYYIAIYKYSTGGDANIHLYSSHPPDYGVASGSLCIPADSPGAMTVGAVFWNEPASIEVFSSRGPTEDGRTKPDLVAPDGVSTATYGASDGLPYLSFGHGFFGTSASAPCAAGSAALVKQRYPSYTPDGLQGFLQGRAVDLGDAGRDNVYGSGRLDLGVLPLAVATMPAADITAGNATLSGNLTSLGGYSSANISFEWGNAADNLTEETAAEETIVAGPFSANVSGLSPSTAYYFRAKAESSGETVYGDVASFNTLKALVSIEVNPDSPTIARGRSQPFNATGTYSDNSTEDITASVNWTSANTSVAIFGADTGLALALAEGSTIITATMGVVTGNTTLTVGPHALDSITITPDGLSIARGRSQQFSATGIYSDNATADITASVTWTSDNMSVASIGADTGLARGLVEGEVTITAVLGGKSDTTILNIGPRVADNVTIAPPGPVVTFYGGAQTQQFTATSVYSDNTTQDVTGIAGWTSSDTGVATINAGGLATILTAGTTTISVIYDGITASTVLQVAMPPPPPPPPPPPAGGSIGGASQSRTILVEYVNDEGKFITDAAALSPDGLVQLIISEGTTAKNKYGQPLRLITIKEETAPPEPPADSRFVCLLYEIGPGGATFDPPALLSFQYSDSQIPDGVAEENMVFATWQDGKWVELEGCTIDTVDNIVTVPINHLTLFTVIAGMTAARFEVGGLTVVPGEVKPGAPVTVNITVTNTGDLTGTYTVILKLNNIDKQNRVITLRGSEVQTVSFAVNQSEAGTYLVSIGGLTGRFTINKPEPEDTVPEIPAPEPTPPPSLPPEALAPPVEQPVATVEPEQEPGITVEPSVDTTQSQRPVHRLIIPVIAGGVLVISLMVLLFVRKRIA